LRIYSSGALVSVSNSANRLDVFARDSVLEGYVASTAGRRSDNADVGVSQLGATVDTHMAATAQRVALSHFFYDAFYRRAATSK
jgi:hypothetical protein